MSACSDSSETRLDVRCIWLTEAEAEQKGLVRKWLDSPADSAEAVWEALVANYLGAPCRQQVDAVLSALGLRVGVHHDNGETT